MPQVLLITSDFPPNLSIAARRPFCLAKYLPEHGWEPVIFTIRDASRTKADHTGIYVIESDLISTPRLVRRFLDFIHGRKKTAESNHSDLTLDVLPHQSSRERIWITKLRQILYYPDRYFLFWFPKAVKKYLRVSKDLKVDAIISTAKPFTTHLIAKHIKDRIHVPWVADFRDLWPHWRFFKSDAYFHKVTSRSHRLLLSAVLSKADALVAVSEPQKLLLERRFPTKKVLSIPNGFDPADYAQPNKFYPKEFLLTHTGQVRHDCQDPEILLRAISKLINEKTIDRTLIKLRFYGEVTSKLLADIQTYQLADVVEATGLRRPRKEIVHKQMESSLLIVLAALDPENTGTATGKIYEYLAAKRPILAIGKPAGEDVLADILKKTRAGIYARQFPEITKTIATNYNHFIKNNRAPYEPSNNEIDRFNYNNLAKDYSDLLSELK
jgi:glycosyltransferase involved in cell wall biosynthesis